jgi:hypothetical protein
MFNLKTALGFAIFTKIQVNYEILAYWKFKIEANGIQKTSFC